jgi:hypothetical protein
MDLGLLSEHLEAHMKTPQADGSSEPLQQTETPRLPERPRVPQKKRSKRSSDAGDAHLGATEDQVSDTQAPAGEDYKDEPKQG